MKLDLYFLSLSSSFFIRTVKGGWHNGAYGENVECPGGQVMVGACSSPVRNWCVKAEGRGTPVTLSVASLWMVIGLVT